MFYGFDSKKESGSFDKERVVYRPWQGGTFGGELDFVYKDKAYRISRTFGKTEKTDAYHLYDLSTNLECHDFSSEIGSEIFGLDSASLAKRFYCGGVSGTGTYGEACGQAGAEKGTFRYPQPVCQGASGCQRGEPKRELKAELQAYL